MDNEARLPGDAGASLLLETVATLLLVKHLLIAGCCGERHAFLGDTCLSLWHGCRMLSAAPYCQCPGEDAGLGGLPAPPSQMHIHISPVIILFGFLAGGEHTLML